MNIDVSIVESNEISREIAQINAKIELLEQISEDDLIADQAVDAYINQLESRQQELQKRRSEIKSGLNTLRSDVVSKHGNNAFNWPRSSDVAQLFAFEAAENGHFSDAAKEVLGFNERSSRYYGPEEQ